jgi:SRSO17 transposase
MLEERQHPQPYTRGKRKTMKPTQDNTPSSEGTTLPEVISWFHSLQQLHAGLASHFARPEPHARALRYVQAILSEVSRKNGWQIAEQAREGTPYGMQRLLSQSVWDADGVRDAIRTFVLQQLGDRPRIAAIDETGFLKRGKHSAGVGKQHYGPTGDLRNCQVGVLLSLVTEAGHAFVDRELYLQMEWIDDPARCASVGIPKTLPFRTKPQLALLMVQRLWQAQIVVDWIVADSVYGSNPELRMHLEAHLQPYVMAVTSTEPVVLELPSIGVRRLEVQELPALLSPSDWQTLAMSEGTKGPRLFDWACLPIWHQGNDDGWHSVLLRRPLDCPAEITSYLVFAPPGTSLQSKVTALGGRWRIEEDIENGKDLGLDHYEVRSFLGWYRHITLVMLALAFLTSIVLAAKSPFPVSQAPLACPSEPVVPTSLCPLSVPEARHLLARLLFPPSSSVPLVLAWSVWRRRHQYRACLCHSRHRLKAG